MSEKEEKWETLVSYSNKDGKKESKKKAFDWIEKNFPGMKMVPSPFESSAWIPEEDLKKALMDGLNLKILVHTFQDMKYWIDRFRSAQILRCISPEREHICDNVSTRIFWQDQAEWYPCCDLHNPGLPQWTGSTRFAPHVMDLPVFPEKALAWLETLDPEDRKRIETEEYERSED